MKVLFVNTLHDRGGAAIAVRRIMDALAGEGVETSLLLLEPHAKDPRAVPNPRFFARHFSLAKLAERLPVLAYRRRWENFRYLAFSPSLLSGDSSDIVNRIGPDIAHLHWINQGHLNPEGIGDISAPVVWTAHDMWPFTGGCHHSDDCERFQENCGACPVLGSDDPHDWSRRLMERKQQHWATRPLSLVCPSNWLARRAEKSTLFRGRRIQVIPNPLDLDRFSPGSQKMARTKLGLPLNVPIVLFGANKGISNPAKGFYFLDTALAAIAARKGEARPELAIVGAGDSQRSQVKADVTVHFLGERTPGDMADVYRAADLFVLPSLHETLPNMVAEAMACGTPALAFDIGGVSDMIEHGRDGYLARPYETQDLENGIRCCLELSRLGVLRQAARVKAEEMFAPRRVARRYMEVYRQALTLQPEIVPAIA